MTELDEVKEAFLDGIYEIFSSIFTITCEWDLWDNSKEPSNVYEEDKDKIYLPSIETPCKLVVSSSASEDGLIDGKLYSVITVPTKTLVTNSIPFNNNDDLNYLLKSKFVIGGLTHFPYSVTPKVYVGNIYQMFEFKCTTSNPEMNGGNYGYRD